MSTDQKAFHTTGIITILLGIITILWINVGNGGESDLNWTYIITRVLIGVVVIGLVVFFFYRKKNKKD
ncbi:LPXTG cell wall anchor domain-containing protein [Geomicrobium sediminis]|uniref:LPXTG-motif cell wall-anchored protein n=1 Tax=Geomicrobium sediminis TaxID=1347788 RepID=A0ABS2P7P5_9BACL|nr:LPXTG cell wall anchor domain-containing protein [Geomicrobium sediminis]MBM7631075.1 LPXTG-motif cell wall-anchored protein [Geomicrobium sediminis]